MSFCKIFCPFSGIKKSFVSKLNINLYLAYDNNLRIRRLLYAKRKLSHEINDKLNEIK